MAISKEDVERLYLSNMKTEEIAKQLGCNKRYVLKLLDKYDLKKTKMRKRTEERVNAVRNLLNQGLTMREVAEKLNTTYDAIRWTVSNYNLTHVNSEKPMPKLMDVRRMWFSERKSIAEIAKVYEVDEEEMRKQMIKMKIIRPVYAIQPKGDFTVRDGFFNAWFRKCEVCGKEFSVVEPEKYAYRIKSKEDKTVYFCSWSHLNQYRSKK